MESNEDRVRTEDAARFTKVHSITIRRASDRGELPSVRDYRNHRWFSLGDLIEWKKKRAQLKEVEAKKTKHEHAA